MRLALVHGFTQTGASWGPVAERLRARGHEVLCPDAAGHGRHADDRLDVPAAAALLGQDVAEGLARGADGAAVWIGYSMGGRLCLRLALDRPDLVAGLILVSTTAGIEDPTERAQRRAADEALADRVEGEGVARFLDEWLAGPLFGTLTPANAGLEHRLHNTAAGLASSLRLCGTGAQEPVWDRLHELTMPVLVVTGDLDPKFTALGDRLEAAVGSTAARTTIAGAGHSVPWEATDAFVDAADRWLRTQSSAPNRR